MERFDLFDRLPPRLQDLGVRLRQRFDRTPEPQRLRILGAALLAVFLLNFSLYASCGWRGCPDPARLKAYQPGGASVLLDRNGREFDDVAPVERRLVRLADLPPVVPAAFIAVEDKRFYQHKGVDWRRVGGAAVRNLFSGRVKEGSSTITMQLSRNIFSDDLRASDRSLRRKLFEARVARRIERKYSKPEILELYLNHIYFGGGAYGVEAAARYYFRESARELSLHEAALLAALPKAPASYDPRNWPRRARERRDLVLRLMAEQEQVTADAAERASRRRLDVSREPPRRARPEQHGAYFAQLVQNELQSILGEELYRKRYRVFTTLDLNAQRAAESLLRRQLAALDNDPALQGAVIVMETLTGDVLALVGGRDYAESPFNRAVAARRQAGSAFKPFVYAAAVAEGYPPSQPILDAPYTFVSNGEPWQPRNFDGEYAGPLTMREALVYSRNVPSVRLASAVGIDAVRRIARDAGISSDIPSTPMVALGITELSPMEMLRAYASFAGLGTRATPRFIQRVVNEDGEVVYQSEVERKETLDRAVAFVVTDMLADAVDYGTGRSVRAAGYYGPAAGKTGTTSEGADAWFAGYTPDLVGVVWLGYDQRRPLPQEATGGSVAAPLWGSLMREVYESRPVPTAWVTPGDIEIRLVDPATGRVLEDGCRPRHGEPREEVFLKDTEVDEVCPDGKASRGVFAAIGAFFSGLFGQDKPESEPVVEQPDRDLGTVRLASRRSESVEEDDSDRDRDGGGKKKGHGKGKAKGKGKR